MRTLFRDQQRDARDAGRLAYARFFWDTCCGLIATAFREHREILFQDADYALRLMRKDFSFTIVVIAILGMAIGASTAAFLAANAILIQPLPFSGGNHLIHLQQRRPGVGVENMAFSVKEIEDYRSQNHTLDSVVEFHEMTFSLLGGREPVRVDTGVVSANFFRILGVTPLYGRTFMDEDDTPNARPVLILSYNFWQKSFGGDPNVVGQKYSMNDKEHVVVGILPPIPQFPSEVDVYMPTVACPTRSGEHALHERQWHMMNVYATLKPGVTLAEAQADLNQIAKRLQTAYPDDYPSAKGYEIGLRPVHEELSHDIRPVLIVLSAAVGLLLLLACANVTGIMVSRMLARTRELAVRTILGAGRNRILRGMITEGIMLAIFGGLAGLVLAYWERGTAGEFYLEIHQSCLATQLYAGGNRFLPSAVVGVRGCDRNGAINRSAFHAAVHDGERQCQRIQSNQFEDPRRAGCGAACVLRDPSGRGRAGAAYRTPPGAGRCRVPTERGPYGANLHFERNAPGILQATAGAHTTTARSGVCRTGEYDTAARRHVGRARADRGSRSESHPAQRNQAQPSGDSNRDTGLLPHAGRYASWPAAISTSRTRTKRMPVVVVNQHLANHYWPDGSAVGKQIAVSPDKWLPIVGVVSDIRHLGLDQDPVDEVYGSLAESPQAAMSVVIRSPQTSPELGAQLRWIAHDIDPKAVVADVRPMMQVRKEWLASRRTTAMFLSVFAVIALCITASGISGMMALTVGERKHEIGVRLAVGATPGSVILSMMKQVLVLMTVGLGTGFGAAWLMSTSMSHVISGIAPRDAITFAVSSALLIAVATASSFVPLTRIAKLDPVVLLRAE